MRDLRAGLEGRHAAGLYRKRRIAEGPQTPERIVDGRRLLAFCSNDYLGLAAHPAVAEAFRRGVDAYGAGSGAAHLVNGHTRAHHALEEELAAFTGRPRALLFSTGYMANLGAITALAGRGDRVFGDRLIHASLIDAARLSGARLSRYAHADPAHLEAMLDGSGPADTLIVTDGVFSMDGDLAPLPALADIARRQDAWLVVDDAHGIGVLGDRGRGTLERFALSPDDAPVLVGTLGKALGTAGAFVAGSEDLVEHLIQNARSYIYTTAMPAAVAEATRASLRLVDGEGWRRERLRALIARLREGARQLGIELMESETPIQPLVVGDSRLAAALAARLLDAGILVPAIRPPTVPPGSARLRITLSAAHEDEHVDRLLDALSRGAGL